MTDHVPDNVVWQLTQLGLCLLHAVLAKMAQAQIVGGADCLRRLVLGHGHQGNLGRIAPGPDYRLYLAPRFVETESDFLALKNRALEVGTVKTFENFIVPLPDSVDVSAFNTVVIWCESFSQFITAAEYR